MHTFRDFRAIRLDTDTASAQDLAQVSGIDPNHIIQDVESSFYLYEMAKWQENARGLRILGVFGILELNKAEHTKHHDELFDDSIATEADVHILPHEQVRTDISSVSTIAPSLLRDGSGPIWAIADTDVIDELSPLKIGPVARTTDVDSVTHRIYALPQPGAKEILRRAIEGSELVLADGHHRVRAAIETLATQAPGSKVELLCFICQAKDVAGIIRPIHRIFMGNDVENEIDVLDQRFEATAIRPETPHIELCSTNRNVYIPVLKTVSATIASVEEAFVAGGKYEIEYSSSSEALRARANENDTVAMIVPAIPVAEIIYAAKKHRPLKPKSTLFYPKPIPSLIIGEAPD